MDLHGVLGELRERRPIFHSEAGFQHALAWRLRERYGAQIRLERRHTLPTGDIYLDLLVNHDGVHHAVELKYTTRALQHRHAVNGFEDLYDLKDQSAQDLRRYDYLKDLQRVEHVVRSLREDGHEARGHALFLTNDRTYWRPPTRDDTIDRDFRLTHGEPLGRKLQWNGGSENTTKGRNDTIELAGSYTPEWRDYTEIDPDHTYGRFKYLLLEADV